MHSEGIILGLPTLRNIKIANGKFKWNTMSLTMKMTSSRTPMSTGTINALKCIDICNLLFNNNYVLSKHGVTRIEDLNLPEIRKWAVEPLKSIIPPSATI